MAKAVKDAEVKKDILEGIMDNINKTMGAGTIYKYGDYQGADKERLRTGILGLDLITGGGWVKGLMNYISGWESSGKSTACLYAIKEAQKEGITCAYIDHEYSFDKYYAESLGVNVDSLIVTQPDTIEQGYQILIDLASTGKVGLILFDSIAAAQTKKQSEGDVGDQSMGVKAKLNSETFPKICSVIKKNNVTLLMVNQLREKIGVMFGSPVTEPGGNSIKFYPSIKVEVRQSTKEKDGDEVTGNLIKAKCTKNKTSRPFREVEYSITYGEGINRNEEIVNAAMHFGLMTKAGSWYKYGETSVGQGLQGAARTLEDNPDMAEELERLVYENIN